MSFDILSQPWAGLNCMVRVKNILITNRRLSKDWLKVEIPSCGDVVPQLTANQNHHSSKVASLQTSMIQTIKKCSKTSHELQLFYYISIKILTLLDKQQCQQDSN